MPIQTSPTTTGSGSDPVNDTDLATKHYVDTATVQIINLKSAWEGATPQTIAGQMTLNFSTGVTFVAKRTRITFNWSITTSSVGGGCFAPYLLVGANGGQATRPLVIGQVNAVSGGYVTDSAVTQMVVTVANGNPSTVTCSLGQTSLVEDITTMSGSHAISGFVVGTTYTAQVAWAFQSFQEIISTEANRTWMKFSPDGKTLWTANTNNLTLAPVQPGRRPEWSLGVTGDGFPAAPGENPALEWSVGSLLALPASSTSAYLAMPKTMRTDMPTCGVAACGAADRLLIFSCGTKFLTGASLSNTSNQIAMPGYTNPLGSSAQKYFSVADYGRPVSYEGSLASASTTIAAGSNGAALPQATLNVAATGTFPTPTGSNPMVIMVTTSAGVQQVTATGLTGTTFTGCTGGVGTMSTGGAVTFSHQISSSVFGVTPIMSINSPVTRPHWGGIELPNYIRSTVTLGDNHPYVCLSNDGLTAWCSGSSGAQQGQVYPVYVPTGQGGALIVGAVSTATGTAAVTSIACSALTTALAAAKTISLVTGTAEVGFTRQDFTVGAGGAALGATSIPVTSATPIISFPGSASGTGNLTPTVGTAILLQTGAITVSAGNTICPCCVTNDGLALCCPNFATGQVHFLSIATLTVVASVNQPAPTTSTLSAGLTNAVATGTSLAITAATYAVASGGNITVISGANHQTFTLTAALHVGDTTATITSVTANFSYPSGSTVYVGNNTTANMGAGAWIALSCAQDNSVFVANLYAAAIYNFACGTANNWSTVAEVPANRFDICKINGFSTGWCSTLNDCFINSSGTGVGWTTVQIPGGSGASGMTFGWYQYAPGSNVNLAQWEAPTAVGGGGTTGALAYMCVSPDIYEYIAYHGFNNTTGVNFVDVFMGGACYIGTSGVGHLLLEAEGAA